VYAKELSAMGEEKLAARVREVVKVAEERRKALGGKVAAVGAENRDEAEKCDAVARERAAAFAATASAFE
jgi:hypothetical protein